MRHASIVLVLLAAPLALSGCQSDPLPEPAPKPRLVKVDRGVLRAFRAYVYAGYGLVLAGERPEEADPSVLRERQAMTRAELKQALIDAGADPAKLSDAASLVGAVRDGIQRTGRYALIPRLRGPHADSVQVVRIRERNATREVRLFEAPFTYRVTSFDETIVADYSRWRAQHLKQPAPREVATYRADGLIQLDLGAAREVGATLFLPNVERLRAAAKAAQDDAFLRRADRLQQLLSLTKSILRWRSLEPLWSRISSRGRDVQLERFAADYAERAELRAAVELHAVKALGERSKEQPLSEDERQRLYELGSLAAVIHGEPLGQVADVLGLAALSLDGPRHEPHYRAARQLVLDFVAAVREGPAGDRADALALSKLARSSPDELKTLARKLHATR